MFNRIECNLDNRGIWIIARILLAVVFLSSGVAKLINFQGGLSEMRAAGLHPDWFFNIATALVLVTGAVLIILDRALWLGAVALIIFLMLTIPFVHRFWDMQQPDATQALYWAMEHVSLAGGLVSAAIASRFRRRLHKALELHCGVIQR